MMRWLNLSGIWLGLGAFLLTLETYAWSGAPLGFSLAALQSFFLTQCAYLLLRNEDFNGRRSVMLSGLTGAVLVCGFDPLWQWWPAFLTLACIAVYDQRWWLSAGLDIPFDLRSFAWLKGIVVASVWWWWTTGRVPDAPPWLLWSNILWLIGLAWLADYRDRDVDGRMNHRFLLPSAWTALIVSQTGYAWHAYTAQQHVLALLILSICVMGSFLSPRLGATHRWHLEAWWLDMWVVSRPALALLLWTASALLL
jgi:hypothetical protein